MAGKRGGVEEIVYGAIEEGIDAILKAHPKFRDAQGYISEHIDKRKLNQHIRHIQGYIAREGEDWSEEQKARFLYKNLANYVASGDVFDDNAKEVILKKTLEERAGRHGERRELEGERYLDKVGMAFRDLYNLISSGDYAQRMPELAQSVATIHDLGFLDSALDVLKSYELLDERKYNMIKGEIEGRVEEEIGKFGESYKSYVKPKKVAAVVLAIFGVILFVLSRAGLTGNVIGASAGNTIGGAVALVMLIIAGFLFLKRKK